MKNIYVAVENKKIIENIYTSPCQFVMADMLNCTVNAIACRHHVIRCGVVVAFFSFQTHYLHVLLTFIKNLQKSGLVIDLDSLSLNKQRTFLFFCFIDIWNFVVLNLLG